MSAMRCAAVAAIGAGLLAGVPLRSAAQPQERFLIIPFENSARDARVYWLAEGTAVLIADDLNALGHRAYTREERLEAFEQLQVPPVASLSRATVIRLGQLVEATDVVIGSFLRAGDQMTVRARQIKLGSGRIESEVAESGPFEDLLTIVGRVTRRIAGATASSPTTAVRPSLEAFEHYIRGLVATSTVTKVGFLQTAIKLDAGFDRARLALWAVRQDEGNGQAALVAASGVPETSPYYAQARFSAALSLIQLKRLGDAFATLRALADRSPSAAVLSNMGVIQMRRPATTGAARATFYFHQALKLDESDPDAHFNLGYAYWAEKDAQTAIFWLREAVRRNPADGEAHAVLAAALQAAGSGVEAGRERELAMQLSSTYAEWAKKPPGGEAIPQGLERLKPSLEVSPVRRIDSAVAVGQREQKELALFHLERGRRLFEQGSHVEATTELRRTLYLSPYEAEAHLLLGRVYLRIGQTPAAIDAFRIALWSQESAAGHLALAQAYVQQDDEARARAALERALELDPSSSDARALLDTLTRR